jgi:5-methyltetrahydrofolate--homocysteine methyltransferase
MVRQTVRYKEMSLKLSDCIVNYDTERIKTLALEAVKSGISPYEVVMGGMSKGMEKVGELYEKGEYFVGELIMAGETMKEGLATLRPYMENGDIKPLGTVVLGTIKEDLHDIGKNIVSILLEASGFKVEDLGVDVNGEKFVRAVKDTDADIVAMSALLTTTMLNMKEVVEELRRAGLREKVKIIIGGAPITEKFMKEIGADAYANDAVKGVEICKKWMKEKVI